MEWEVPVGGSEGRKRLANEVVLQEGGARVGVGRKVDRAAAGSEMVSQAREEGATEAAGTAKVCEEVEAMAWAEMGPVGEDSAAVAARGPATAAVQKAAVVLEGVVMVLEVLAGRVGG